MHLVRQIHRVAASFHALVLLCAERCVRQRCVVGCVAMWCGIVYGVIWFDMLYGIYCMVLHGMLRYVVWRVVWLCVLWDVLYGVAWCDMVCLHGKIEPWRYTIL